MLFLLFFSSLLLSSRIFGALASPSTAVLGRSRSRNANRAQSNLRPIFSTRPTKQHIRILYARKQSTARRKKTDTISVLLVKFTLIIIRTNEITRIRFSDYVACDEEADARAFFSASPLSVVVRVHFSGAHVHFMSEV